MKYKIFYDGKMFQSNEHDPNWVIQMNGSIGKFNGKNYDTIKDAKALLFTGLKDKNGEEIYDGDVLNYHYSDGDTIMKVFYNDCTASFDVEYEETGECESLYTLDFEEHTPKVIGNIYSNPTLFKSVEV